MFGRPRDRSMVVRKAERVDIECVVRGYLAGSGWAEYPERQHGRDERSLKAC